MFKKGYKQIGQHLFVFLCIFKFLFLSQISQILPDFRTTFLNYPFLGKLLDFWARFGIFGIFFLFFPFLLLQYYYYYNTLTYFLEKI
jgi:hypothetical protein